MEQMIAELESLIRSIEFDIRQVEFDIDWAKKANEEHGKKIYEDTEVRFMVGRKKGLLTAINRVKEHIDGILFRAKLDESHSKMISLFNQMSKLLDDDKQPKSNSPSTTL